MNKPPRILQIANRAGPLYVFMLPLCRMLSGHGAHVELACMPGDASWQPLKESGFKVHALPAGNWKNPSTWWKVYRSIRLLLRNNQFDLMIVHTPAMSWIARPTAKGLVAKTVYFAHGLPFVPGQRTLKYIIFLCIERLMAKYTNGLIVMNSDDAAVCERIRLVRPDGHWKCVPGVGVDVDVYGSGISQADTDELAAELGLRRDKPMVLYLGRFIKAKRPGDVLELARRIGDKADFVLAGEGPLWKEIKARASLAGSHIKVIGFTQKAKELMSLCSVVVLPSVFREGLPRVLLEAHAAGKPAVAYDIRGVRDIIGNGETGFLIQPGDVDELCTAVCRLLDDVELRHQMGRAAQKKVLEKFTTERSLSAIMSAINEVVGPDVFDLKNQGSLD